MPIACTKIIWALSHGQYTYCFGFNTYVVLSQHESLFSVV